MNSLKLAILTVRVRQYELAQRAQLTETRLSRLVTGRAHPTDEEIGRLAAALGVPEASLCADGAGPSSSGGGDQSAAPTTSSSAPRSARRRQADHRNKP